MKLLSDFDGVWTQPGDEARAQGERLDAALADLVPPGEKAAADSWIRSARVAALAEPRRYGWLDHGRLSAFGDEDPFTAHAALMHYVEASASRDAIARTLREGAARSAGSLDALGSRAHAEGVASVERRRGPGILAEAAEAGRRLLASGAEIVVVSNSDRHKLTTWFEHAHVPITIHPEYRDGAPRLRGGARKFELAPEAGATLALGDVTIDIARPRYSEALEEERPDAIVGDVFSLDLSLPLALKRARPEWRHVRLFWLTHAYAPAWLRERVERHAAGEVECVEDGLPGVVRRLGA